MKFLSVMGKAALIAAALGTPAAAAVVVPDSGTSEYIFSWIDGLGPIDEIGGTSETEWSLTLTTASTVTFTATDAFVVGDYFGLLLGGLSTPWTTVGSSGPYFQGIFSAPLAAGSYLFSLEVTDLAPDFTDGDAFASFAVTPSVVPLPAGGMLLVAAMGMLAALRRRVRV